MGYFDYESYFVFKHWPFKIFNVNWKNKWTLLKYPVVIIVIGLVIGGFFYNETLKRDGLNVKRTYSSMGEQMKINLYEVCMDKITHFSNEFIIDNYFIPIQKNENHFFYDENMFKNIDTIEFGCNFETLICQHKPFDQEKKIEEQINLKEGNNAIYKRITETGTHISVINTYHYTELLHCSSSFVQEEKDLKVVKEFEEIKVNTFKKIFDVEIPQVTWKNYFDLSKMSIVNIVEIGNVLGIYRNYQNVIDYEIGPVYEIRQNMTFYDNATTLERHITNLDENVEILYSMYLSADKSEKENRVGGWGSSMTIEGAYSYKNLVSLGRSMEYLGAQFFGVEELANSLDQIRKEYNEDYVVELYQNKDVQESLESKAIRLKILETLLAKKVMGYTKMNGEEMGEITKSPELLH